MAHQNLESRLNEYKSKGEKVVSEKLEKYDINFKYEKSTCVMDKNGKKRLWYPDFYLDDYGILIEYIGRPNDPNYMEGTSIKKEAYKRMGAKVIYVYGDDVWEIRNGKPKVKEGFEKYLIDKINEKISESYDSHLKSANIGTSIFPNYAYS